MSTFRSVGVHYSKMGSVRESNAFTAEDGSPLVLVPRLSFQTGLSDEPGAQVACITAKTFQGKTEERKRSVVGALMAKIQVPQGAGPFLL